MRAAPAASVERRRPSAALGIDAVAQTEAFAKFQDEELTRNAALLKSVDFMPN